jgi:hypothetical protein
VLFLGFPLWWALGLQTLLPMALAVVLADQLLRRRRIVLPEGFALWALFLAWVAVGVLVLWVDAPSAVPGGGASRLLVFGYRATWYLTGTMMLLWVANLRESELPTRWLFQLLGFMFVVTTVGGLVGVLLPTVEFRSLVELLLPAGIRGNNLVQSMVHPAVADLENVLGRPTARPKAPFAFANSWGSSFALYLPFFLVSWWRDGAGWQRVAVPVVLLGATLPVVYSLNRGLWVCLGVGALGYLALQLRRARVAPLVVAVTLLLAFSLAFFASPLGTIFAERLAHAHSNERRGLLLTQTVLSTVQGSPVIGFGSTRDVQGSFASIAGADTPDCKACGLPPLGTQGHLWLVVFSQGLLGAAFFLTFFLVAFMRTWRCRTTTETLCTFVLVFFGLQLFVYDTLGMPMMTVMLAIGAVWREQATAGRRGAAGHDAREALMKLRAAAPFLGVLCLSGALLGAGVAALTPTRHATTVAVLLDDVPVQVTTQDPDAKKDARRGTTTVDTEAGWITSDETLGRAVGSSDPRTLERLRHDVTVTAAANTRVVFVEVRARTAAASHRLSVAVVRSYLAVRGAALAQRQDRALAQVDRAALTVTAKPIETDVHAVPESVSTLVLTPRTAGRVLRTGTARPVGRQPEVPVASGAALGLALGALLLAARPHRVPVPRLRRRRGPRR